jgi:hypothetical protein
MTVTPAPWRNPVYVAATIVQAFARPRWRPELAYTASDLRRHLFPSAAERERQARRELPYFAITTLMLDEARDLREWIEFHRLQGIERFYLYDNGSSDAMEEVVRPYVEQGIVEFTRWPYPGAQRRAIADCFRRHRNDVRWLVCMDVDEFLFCGEAQPPALHPPGRRRGNGSAGAASRAEHRRAHARRRSVERWR